MAGEVAASPEAMAVHPLAFAYVVMSVADMDQALGLWVRQIGMEIVTRRTGPDAALARAWGLDAAEIVDQALLRTPGAREGGIHLVRFRQPGPAVREGAAPTDLVPKSVDVGVRDIQARFDELTAAGYRFRSSVNRMGSQPGREFYEVHMHGPDEINIVLLEVPARPRKTNDKGYAVAVQLVMISPDNTRDAAFFKALLGIEQVSGSRISGPEIERTVGLPPGAALDIRIVGDREIGLGRVEIVQYTGAPSRDLYPRARPPARGILSVTYLVPDVAPILAAGAALGVGDLGEVDGIYGPGRMATATTPAGLRVDVFAPRR